jgi:hypothetical protein
MPIARRHGLADDILATALDDSIDPLPCVIEVGTYGPALLR